MHFRRDVLLGLSLACAFFTRHALAYFGVPYITPPQPMAGEQFAVNIDQGLCDNIVFEPSYPEVTQQGNSVRVLLLALRYENPELCFLPVGTATIPLGPLPAGSYSVAVDVVYYDSHGDPQTARLGVVQMHVSSNASNALPAPATDLPALFVLAGLLVMAVKRKQCSHRS